MNIPLYGQRDSRWANQLINNVKGSTIGRYGCTISCLSMISGRNPGQQETFMRGLGAFIDDLVDWRKTPGFKWRFYCENTPAPIEEIKKEIRAGRPVLLNVFLGSGKPKPNHWVLCVDENFTIHDPWYGEKAPITKRYGVAGLAILGGAYFNPQTNLNPMKHVQSLRYEGQTTVYGLYAYEKMEEVIGDIVLYGKPSLIKTSTNPEVSLKIPIPTFDSVKYLGLTPEKDMVIDDSDAQISSLTSEVKSLKKLVDGYKGEVNNLDDALEKSAEYNRQLDKENAKLQAMLESFNESDPIKDDSFIKKVVEYIYNLFTKK